MENQQSHACHYDGDIFPSCVIDEDLRPCCNFAADIEKKEECPRWQKIEIVR